MGLVLLSSTNQEGMVVAVAIDVVVVIGEDESYGEIIFPFLPIQTSYLYTLLYSHLFSEAAKSKLLELT